MRVLNSTRETKTYQPNIAQNISVGGTLISLTQGMNQGTGRQNRIGNKIFIKSVDVNLLLRKPDGDYTPQTVRVIMCRSLKSDLDLSDLPNTSSGPVNRSAAFVYYDQIVSLDYDISFRTNDTTPYIYQKPSFTKIIQGIKRSAFWYDDPSSTDSTGHLFLAVLPMEDITNVQMHATVWFADS